MATSLGMGRPADRKNLIVEEFRTRIVTGELHPGSRFPTHAEIGQQYGAGKDTVQSALESLREDGFIRVNGRRGGTFVADNPPHLSRYAVVFSRKSDEIFFGHFWTSIVSELGCISSQNPGCQLLPYYGLDGHEDNEDFLRLCHEILNHRIAGVIFTSYPYQLKNTPIVDEPNIPRVSIMSPGADPVPYPIIFPDQNSFFIGALEYLRDRGHRRIAFIYNSWTVVAKTFIQDLVEAHGLESRPYWFQGIDIAVPTDARNCVNLLMHCHEVPDALLICDDTLVEAATAGLLDAHDRVPGNFEVVAHSNFPYTTPSLVPAKRLGYDVRQILQKCVDNINAQREGIAVPAITELPACFEDELALTERV